MILVVKKDFHNGSKFLIFAFNERIINRWIERLNTAMDIKSRDSSFESMEFKELDCYWGEILEFRSLKNSGDYTIISNDTLENGIAPSKGPKIVSEFFYDGMRFKGENENVRITDRRISLERLQFLEEQISNPDILPSGNLYKNPWENEEKV